MGGSYGYLKISDQVMCNYPTGDGGTLCNTSDICRSYCIVDLDQEVCPKNTDDETCTSFPGEWPEEGECWPYLIVDPEVECIYLTEGYFCFT